MSTDEIIEAENEENEVTGAAETEELEKHKRLTRYADYDDFAFYHTDSMDEFPRGPIQISVGGRICGSLTLDWEGIGDVLGLEKGRGGPDRGRSGRGAHGLIEDVVPGKQACFHEIRRDGDIVGIGDIL